MGVAMGMGMRILVVETGAQTDQCNGCVCAFVFGWMEEGERKKEKLLRLHHNHPPNSCNV